MCIVTFIPVGDQFFITSNRDEKFSRRQALPPTMYQEMIFPKDADAGGTWITMHENGNAGVLLNGAFEKHIVQPPYRKSRGLIFLDILYSASPSRKFDRIDLDNIEPFTVIVLDAGNLFECRWDGQIKHCRQLRNYRPYIWSSATLYTKEIVKKREQLFAAFLNKNPQPTQQQIIHFHQQVLMETNDVYTTVSITGLNITKDVVGMKYIDLKNNKQYQYDQEVVIQAILY